ncbi:single-stranded DNA-binding protein [Candidatus Pacearchaeota archaeon]|nr:single-stranded DNA-binding protein [Candidatus Pacearchaeota archaeon]
MSSLNKVLLIGRLGQDPEIRCTQDGREIANFSLATSDKWTDKKTGDKKERTEWHRVSVFNEGLVKVIKTYVKKGNLIYIEGKLQTRKWTDDKGIERYSTEITLQGFDATLKMLGSKQDKENDRFSSEQYAQASGASGARAPVAQEKQTEPKPLLPGQESEDDIPF